MAEGENLVLDVGCGGGVKSKTVKADGSVLITGAFTLSGKGLSIKQHRAWRRHKGQLRACRTAATKRRIINERKEGDGKEDDDELVVGFNVQVPAGLELRIQSVMGSRGRCIPANVTRIIDDDDPSKVLALSITFPPSPSVIVKFATTIPQPSPTHHPALLIRTHRQKYPPN